NEAEIAQDFGLGGVFFRPRPLTLQVGIEGVSIVNGLDIAACPGISIPVPGAADVATFLQRHGRKAGLAQAMQQIETGKAGTDHGNIDLLHRSLARRFRSACCSHCLLHPTPPVYFVYVGAGYSREPALSSGVCVARRGCALSAADA